MCNYDLKRVGHPKEPALSGGDDLVRRENPAPGSKKSPSPSNQEQTAPAEQRKIASHSVAPYNADVSPTELFAGGRTLAVFASTRVDQISDAVALASQRAAFRLLYRLVKRPADPNLAIAASAYRQGVRLLLSAL